jgi:type I restriction enzyme, S subunit
MTRINFSDSGEMLLPKEWRMERVADAYRFTRKPKEIRYGDFAAIPFIPMNLIPDGGITTPSFKEKPPQDISSGTYFEKGDLLLSKITPSFENGKQAIATNLPTPFGIATTEVIPIQSIDGSSNIHFLFYYLLKADVRQAIAAKMEGSTGRQRVSEHVVRDWLMPVPPLPEQEKISAVLWKIHKAVEIEDAIVRNTRDLKKSLLRRLFTHGLRGEPLKETEIGRLPESWDVHPLSECAHVQTGVAKGRPINPSDLIQVPYLRVANVQHGHLDLHEMKKIQIRRNELARYSLRKDDVVVTEGGDFDKLGRGFIWDGQIAPCVHQNHIFAVRPHRDRLLPRYFAYFVQSPHGRGYFLTVAHKTTNLACINTSKLKALPVLLPPLGDQEKIADILQTIDQKIDIHESKKRSLQDLFKTTLHKLMVAQIRVNDLDIDTSEVSA